MIDIIQVKKFSMEIEKLVEREELNYIEAIIKFCEIKDVEIESVIHFVEANKKLKNKLFLDASHLHLIKKTATLNLGG